jgi:thiol-disulfide isomerase/thioredoxin
MVICIIALVVLGIMSIFSAKYRSWAREAASCVARMATLRPCETGCDDKVKAVITSVLMRRNERFARFAHIHFKAISWIFMIVFVASLGYSAYTVYNLAVFGTCDPANPQNCIFNPGGNPNKVVCPYESFNTAASITTIGGFRNIESANIEGRPVVYFFGTTWCPHCAWERPIFRNITEMFSDFIDVKMTDIDVSQPPVEMSIFSHYSPKGDIPVIIIGGKYFRVGSGENISKDTETKVLTALLCKVTNSTIEDCKSSDIAAMVQSI